MAPVLTRLFTPLFAAVLVTFLGALLWTGGGIDVERDVLIGFDLLLVVVLGLLLYSLSARDPRAPPGVFDAIQVVLVVSALVVDAVALWAIVGAHLRARVQPEPRGGARRERDPAGQPGVVRRALRGASCEAAGRSTRLERWQTAYLPVYAAWAAIVVIVFPPAFGYA